MNGWFALVGVPRESIREYMESIAGQFHWLDSPGLGVYLEGEAFLGMVSSDGTRPLDEPESGLALAGLVRLDFPQELAAALGGQEQHWPHTKLVLSAYKKWDEGFLEKIAGDYSFAIWDVRKRSLLVVRDHFGVLPVYYAPLGSGLAVSNSLSALAALSGLANELDSQWIGDFLLFEQALSEEATIFKGIRRLPRGHTLSYVDGRLQVRQYWTLPSEFAPLPWTRRELPKAFREVLQNAVKDRAKAAPTAISLSGGLDSASVAALAVQANGRAGVVGFSQRWRASDPEEVHVQRIADHLGIEIRFVDAHDVKPFVGDILRRLPEPFPDPLREAASRFAVEAAAASSCMLSGEGADEVLTPATLGEGIGWKEVYLGAFPYLVRQRRLPPVGLRTWLRGKGESPPKLPSWINPEFAQEFGLEERLLHWQRRLMMPPTPRRKAWRALTQLAWLPALEGSMPEFTGQPVTMSYPFLDLRVVRFAMAAPPIPWCLNKQLLREAMAAALPPSVIRRSKVPFGPDTVQLAMQSWMPAEEIRIQGRMLRFVEPTKLPREITKVPAQILMLAFWLNSRGKLA